MNSWQWMTRVAHEKYPKQLLPTVTIYFTLLDCVRITTRWIAVWVVYFIRGIGFISSPGRKENVDRLSVTPGAHLYETSKK